MIAKLLDTARIIKKEKADLDPAEFASQTQKLEEQLDQLIA
jgi:hypothetical protein